MYGFDLGLDPSSAREAHQAASSQLALLSLMDVLDRASALQLSWSRSSHIGPLSVEDDGNLLQSLALGLDEPAVCDEALDDQDDDVDDVVFPSNVREADWLPTMLDSLRGYEGVLQVLTFTYWFTNTAHLVAKT